MGAAAAAARTNLAELAPLVGASGRIHLDSARAALDEFTSVNTEIVTLSRRNSNVRSLALSLGRKRSLTAECDEQLRALQEALSKHAIQATR